MSHASMCKHRAGESPTHARRAQAPRFPIGELDEIVSHGKQLPMATKLRVKLAHEAIERLTQLTDLFQLRREQLAASAGLTVSQWSVLEEISTERFMPSLFAAAEATSRAAVSKVIRQLLDRDLIHVAISQNDGRQRDYALTADGKGTLERLR